MKKSVYLFICLFVFICSFCFSACNKKSQSQKPLTPKIKTIIISPADLEKIQFTNFSESFPALGELKPIKESVVNSEVNGLVLQVNVEEGDRVRAGQLLAVLDSKDLTNQLRQSQENLSKKLAEKNLSEITFGRKQISLKEDLISKAEFDTAETDLKIKQREVESAKLQIKLSRSELSKANIKSPINGLVSKKYIKNGEFAQPGKQLFEIISINPLKVEISVPSQYLSQIKIGQPLDVKVDSLPDKVFKAKIIKINPQADQETRSIVLIAHINNSDEALKAGLSVNCLIKVANPKPSIIIPKEAIAESISGEKFVFVLSENRKTLKQRFIKANSVEGESTFYLVTEGLTTGDIIVKVPLEKTDEELKVEIME